MCNICNNTCCETKLPKVTVIIFRDQEGYRTEGTVVLNDKRIRKVSTMPGMRAFEPKSRRSAHIGVQVHKTATDLVNALGLAGYTEVVKAPKKKKPVKLKYKTVSSQFIRKDEK